MSIIELVFVVSMVVGVASWAFCCFENRPWLLGTACFSILVSVTAELTIWFSNRGTLSLVGGFNFINVVGWSVVVLEAAGLVLLIIAVAVESRPRWFVLLLSLVTVLVLVCSAVLIASILISGVVTC